MNLGEKIYKLRKEKGLSQEALASVYKGILHKTTKNGLPTY